MRSRREFDHTGDLGIEVEAESLAGVFEETALGMFGLLTDLIDVKGTREIPISVTGSDLESLLLNWLSELNFLHLTERLLFGEFSTCDIGETHVDAVARGEPIDPDRHKIHTEIKAVTYHDMIVERRGDGWYVRVIFDI